MGNPEASVVFVTEYPTPVEISKGVPIAGLNKTILDTSIPKGLDYCVVSALRCMPTKVKQAPKHRLNIQNASGCCGPDLREFIAKHPRKIIVAMGNASIWALTGNYEINAQDERGRLFESTLAELGIVAAVSPTTISAGGSSLGKFKDDINYAMHLLGGGKPKVAIKPQYKVFENQAEFESVVDEAIEKGLTLMGADIETTGFDHRLDRTMMLGLCFDPKMVYILDDKNMSDIDHSYRDFDKSYMDGGPFKWIWSNGKFDVKFLNNIGWRTKVDEDVMLMSYALEERGGFHSLDMIGKDWIGAENHKSMLDPYLPNKKTSYEVIPKKVLHPYLAFDSSYTLQCYNKMLPHFEEGPNKTLYREVLLPSSEVLRTIEQRGMYVNLEQVKENDLKIGELVEQKRDYFNKMAEDLGFNSINPNSPKQVSDYLYGYLKLAHPSRSTDEKTLLKLPPHNAIDALLDYRGVNKELTTYIKPLYEHTGTDGRVHATYKLHGTVTGRLASEKPNMQNVPRTRHMRNMFKAAPGNILVAIDLDQAELRCLATLSEDEALCRIYLEEGLSLHKEVSADLWGDDWLDRYALDEPTDPKYILAKSQYMRTKALNFGIVYGRTAPSIASEFKVPVEEAQSWLDMWAVRFPDAWSFIQKCRLAPVKRQNLLTPFGRRKRFTIADSSKLYGLQNEAANFPHQSIASDITLVGAHRMQEGIAAWDARLVNIVHDENVIEMPNDMNAFNDMAKYAISVMEQVPRDFGLTHIPFLADAKVGTTWGDLKNAELS